MVALLLVGACSSGGSSSDDPAAALAERVQAVLASPGGGGAVVERLAAFGVDVTVAELAEGAPLCPRVEDPEPGDEATCRLAIDGDELELDVEFGADGSIQVVDAAVAP